MSDPSTPRSTARIDERSPDDAASEDAPVTFERSGLRAGFRIGLPVAIGVGGYGITFGILATQAGLSVAEATLMSATVVAGAAQIVAIELWTEPIPIAAILLTTLAINFRYLLLGAALEPWFRQLSTPKAYGSLFFMADENWALTLRDLKAGSGRGAFLLGSGFALWSAWVVSTAIGALAGGAITDPAAYGIDFILAVVFVALAVDLWEGAASILPWSVALVTALVASAVLPGQWYILLGGIAAGVAEMIRYD